jgi:hypothetical protein
VEFNDISTITEPTEPGYKAVVHGVICSFSPMKESKKKCFDGYTTNGTKKMRFVGFSHKKKTELSSNGNAVLSECSIKKARSGDSLEVIVSDDSQVAKSTKTFVDCKSLHNPDIAIDISLSLIN